MAMIKQWADVPLKHRRVLEWWLQAYRWFNRRHPSHAKKIRIYTKGKSRGFWWGSLDVKYILGMSSYGIWMLGGYYTQHYLDYYILKNAPIKNPPSTRPRKPSGYDEWFARWK